MQLHRPGVERSQARENAERTERKYEMQYIELKGRALWWLLPVRNKNCHGCCLFCRWYRHCREDTGSRKGVHMSRVMRPTLAQKKYLKGRGLVPTEWYVIKDTPEQMEVVSRKELARQKMRRLEGVDTKLRTKTLRKEEA